MQSFLKCLIIFSFLCSFELDAQTIDLTAPLRACPSCKGDETVTDIDGNVYQAKKMPDGNIWMIENLRTSRYANGDSIPNTPGETLSTPYFVKASQFPKEGFTLRHDTLWGYYYNWAAAMGYHSDSSGKSIKAYQTLAAKKKPIQGICPDGWHLPDRNEWDTLLFHIRGGHPEGVENDRVAVKMACGELPFAQGGWKYEVDTVFSPGEYYIQEDEQAKIARPDNPDQNESCFSVLPAGRYPYLNIKRVYGIEGAGYVTSFWSSSADMYNDNEMPSSSSTFLRNIAYIYYWDEKIIYIGFGGVFDVSPVRCIKNRK